MYSADFLFLFSKKKISPLINFLAIGENLSTVLHVGNHIPMNGRLVFTPRLKVRLPDRHVNRPPDLFVKKDILRKTVNIIICSDGSFAKMSTKWFDRDVSKPPVAK